jgi:hypothetical protein
MRTKLYLMLAIALFLLGATALAQEEPPKAEVFGGFSYMRTAGNTNVNGWTTQASFHMKSYISLAADFGGNYQTKSDSINRPSASMFSFMFGPQVADRTGKITGFAHALFGGARVGKGFALGKGGVSATATNFAMAFGGGIDANISDQLAFRIFQLDYLVIRADNAIKAKEARNNFRLAIGIVYKIK